MYIITRQDKFTQHMHSRGRAYWLPTSGEYIPPDITADLARLNLPPPGDPPGCYANMYPAPH